MFLTLFGLIWILSDKFFLPHEDKEGFGGGAFEKRRSQIVKNIEVYHFGPFGAFLDHFGMLTSLPCLAIFVCFNGAGVMGV